MWQNEDSDQYVFSAGARFTRQMSACTRVEHHLQNQAADIAQTFCSFAAHAPSPCTLPHRYNLALHIQLPLLSNKDQRMGKTNNCVRPTEQEKALEAPNGLDWLLTSVFVEGPLFRPPPGLPSPHVPAPHT